MAGTNSNEKCRWCNGRPHPAEFPWKFKCFIQHKGNGVNLVDSLNIGGSFYLHLENKDILTEQQISAIRLLLKLYPHMMLLSGENLRTGECTVTGRQHCLIVKVKHAVVASSLGNQVEGGKGFADAFKDIKAYLSRMIDASIPFLLKCQDYDVIEGVDYEEIRAQPTPTGKANRLLEILERRNRRLLPAFLRALTETGQVHVAQEIQENMAK